MKIDDVLVPGLSSVPYVSDRRHSLLDANVLSACGPNIGSNGERLTISFLSMNRSSLSLRLLDSIRTHLPGFAGEVLIIDNGSAPAELQTLRDALAQMPFRSRIVELGQNYGVAGGRNRTIPHVSTEWLMSLDNDIYFIKNPLPAIQRDLAITGAHFLDLPLLDPDGKTLFAMGGNLYIANDDAGVHLGAGSAVRQQEWGNGAGDAFLCTFLLGGASLLKCETFTRVGGYDEGMFVGFEDIDFSVRLFREGYKVASTTELALIHDHPPPSTNEDQSYEKKRFSRSLIEASARHLEKKYGFRIWNHGVDEWLKTRHTDLGLMETTTPEPPAGSSAPEGQHVHRPKIGLIIDTENWAFGNIARQISKWLSDRYEFLIIPMDVIDDINHVMMLTADCELVHFFWREHLTLIGTEHARQRVAAMGLTYEEFDSRFVRSKVITTSVYDHLNLEGKDVARLRPIFNERIGGYTVSSEKLRTIYQQLEGYVPPAAVIEDGVDLERFRPARLDRFLNLQRPLIVGWTGNSRWASELEDFKGFHSILLPALDRLEADGIQIQRKFADRQEGFIPHHRMVDYYNSIDLYICPSKIEGTPNPVLESMACGVPIVSTDVGIVPQAFGPLQKSLILPERSVDALVAAVKRLVQSPEQFAALSQENLASVQSWDWRTKTEQFGAFFASMLEKARRAGKAAGH